MVGFRRSVSVLTLVVALMLGALGPASAKIQRRYAGETSQDERVTAHVIARDGRISLRYFTVRVIRLACDDGSTMRWGVGFGFGGRGMPLGRDKRFALDERFLSDAVHAAGRFWPGRARGTFELTVAALTEDEQAMLCASGELTWQMVRTAPAPSDDLDTSRLDGVTRVRVAHDGAVRIRSRQL